MTNPRNILIAGGLISAIISLFHLVLVLEPKLYAFIVSDQENAIAQMAVQGSAPIVLATVILAIMFGVWAFYAFSGAALINPLPFLKKGLNIIGTVYFLRSLFMISEIDLVITQGYPIRFVFFSALSLLTGVLYLIGGLKHKRSSVPG